MNKNIFCPKLLLIITASLFSVVTAQIKPTKKLTKNSAVIEIHLPVSVIKKSKQFVSGLTNEDFIILENGRRQKATFFTDEKNSAPNFFGVLMDTSQSTQTKIDNIKDIAKDLVYSLTRLRKDEVAFMTFDYKVTLWQDFTNKIDWLDSAINRVKESGQQNSLYDAIYQFCDEKLRTAPGRHIIIVISDGKDTFSRVNLKDAIDIAQRTETVIFIVSTNDNSLKPIENDKIAKIKHTNDKHLLQLTAETGGATFFASNTMQFDKAFAKILKEIHSQYVFTYCPTNQKYDGKERKIKVKFADGKKDKEYKIRTKTKYRVLKAS